MTAASCLSGKQVLMLSSVDWTAAWQRHHALAEGFLQTGAEVFFVENTGFRGPRPTDFGRVFRRLGKFFSRPERRGKVKIITPFAMPPTHPVFRMANAYHFIPGLLKTLRRLGMGPDPVVFAYLPTETTLCILDHLRPSLLVYDCVDNFSGHPFPPKDLAATESELLSRSDLVLTTSRYLYEAKSASHPKVIQLHHGVSHEFFLNPRTPSREYRRFCYFGTIWSAVDFAPIQALARAGFEVTLIGPVKEAPPLLEPSVHRLGPVPHEKLPSLLEGFDGLLLPYVDSKYNQGVIPAKIYECLATGKPVLASSLPSMEAFSHLIDVCRTPSEFVEAARKLPATDAPEKASARVAEARRHATPLQIARIEQAMTDALRNKQPQALQEPLKVRGVSETARTFMLGFSWIAMFFLLARCATFLTQFLAARFLGPEQYGKAHLVLAVSSLIQIVPILGFPLALARFGSMEETETGRRSVVSTSLAAFLAWSILCLAALVALSPWLSKSAHLSPTAWRLTLAFTFMTAIHLVAGSALQGLSRFKERGWAEAAYGLVAMAALGVLLPAGHRGFEDLIVSFMVGLGVAAVYALWKLRSYLRLDIDPRWFTGLLPFVLLGVVNILALAFVQAPGRIAVYHYHSAHMAGIYSVYFTATAQVALAVNNMAQTVIVPLASRPQGQKDVWNVMGRLSMSTAVLLILFFAASATLALLVIGRSYPLRWDWIILFTVAAALILVHGVTSAVFYARDLKGLAVSSGGMLAAGLVNLLANLALTPRLGVTGGGLALVLGYGLGLAWYSYCRPRHGNCA